MPANHKERTAIAREAKRPPSQGSTPVPFRFATPALPGSGEFVQAAREQAEKAGCRYLFELPPVLIDSTADHAAAIVCPEADGFAIWFVLYRSDDRELSMVSEREAPQHIADFAYSFARVMSLMPTETESTLQ